MKINNIPYNNIIISTQNNRQYGLRLKPQLNCDCVCFKGSDLLDLPKEDIMTKIQDAIKPENILGHGAEAKVYRIKDTDYCVRIPYCAGDMYSRSYTKELTPADKLNHVRARLGFGAAILDYFEGVTPNKYKKNIDCRNIFQEKISELPTKAYNSLLQQIACAIDNEMLYDFSGGNLIVDLKNEKLTAIDFYNKSENPRPAKPLCEMYSVLTCYGAKEKTGKKIYDKVVDAALEEFKPNKVPCMDVELFDFVDLARKRDSDANFKTDDVLKEINDFLELIKEISQTAKTLKDIKKKEIINKTLSSQLLEKTGELKALLLKVR